MTDIIDSATGLPKVPEGYFWKISPSGKYAYVELRRKYFFGLASKVVSSRIVLRNGLAKEKVLGMAVQVYREYSFTSDNGKNLYGAYPPKKLGASK